MSPELDTKAIASLSLHDLNMFSIQHSQTLHRVKLLGQWNIAEGSRVLEVGCGQGDCTTVLGSAVGVNGQVVAVDPADLGYGAPYTLGQAQGHISKGPLGNRITWVQQSPLDYLSSSETNGTDVFDATVLAHSLWYFSEPALIMSTFSALRKHSNRLLLAEWSLVATHPSAYPHVLAALAQAAFECRRSGGSDSNVRTVLAPKRLIDMAEAAGWKLEKEALLETEEDLADGRWEVSACVSPSFETEVENQINDQGEKAAILALRDACEASLQGVESGRKGVRSMAVWVASFT